MIIESEQRQGEPEDYFIQVIVRQDTASYSEQGAPCLKQIQETFAGCLL